MSRVRAAEYQDLRSRVESRALEGLMFVHLKKGLGTEPIDWVACDDPTIPDPRPVTVTEYGVDKDIQTKLAAIRTDLDSFTEVEAYALMASGYLMTEKELKELDRQHKRDGMPGSWGDFDAEAPRGRWDFLELESIMGKPPGSSDLRREDLGRQLEAGGSLFFKIWKLSTTLRTAAYGGGAAVALGLAFLIRDNWTTQFGFSMSVGALVVALLIAGGAIVSPLLKWLDPQRAVQGYFWKAVAALLGWAFSNLHLKLFDRMFLERGKLARLMKLPAD
jgi:hypothetical protein